MGPLYAPAFSCSERQGGASGSQAQGLVGIRPKTSCSTNAPPIIAPCPMGPRASAHVCCLGIFWTNSMLYLRCIVRVWRRTLAVCGGLWLVVPLYFAPGCPSKVLCPARPHAMLQMLQLPRGGGCAGSLGKIRCTRLTTRGQNTLQMPSHPPVHKVWPSCCCLGPPKWGRDQSGYIAPAVTGSEIFDCQEKMHLQNRWPKRNSLAGTLPGAIWTWGRLAKAGG